MQQNVNAPRESATSFARIAMTVIACIAVFCLPYQLDAQDARLSDKRQIVAEVANNFSLDPPSKQIAYSNEDRQSANRTITLANKTLRHSREAFRRGLMEFADFELQLKTSLKMKLTAAEVLHDRKLQNRFIQQYRTTIDNSVKLLKRFHQPGAQGWAGDVRQAELLASEARQLSAVFNEDRNGIQIADRLRKRQALALLRIRAKDYRQGLASVSQLNAAVIGISKPLFDARILKSHQIAKNKASHSKTTLNRFQNRMKRELSNISRRSSSHAGIGRVDRVFEQQTKLRQLRGSSRNQNFQNRKIQQLDRANVNRQNYYYRNKTTTVFDLTRTWLLRQDAIEESRRTRQPLDTSRTRFHNKEFLGLVNRASRIHDLRGRNAADVSFIESLAQYSQLSESVFKKQEEALEKQEKQNVDSDLTGFMRIQFR